MLGELYNYALFTLTSFVYFHLNGSYTNRIIIRAVMVPSIKVLSISLWILSIKFGKEYRYTDRATDKLTRPRSNEESLIDSYGSF